MQKNKAIQNVSATTAIDLKAQLAQHVEQFEKTRSSTGKQIKAGKPDKKPTVWTRQNKGVQGRNQKDAQQQLTQVEGSILAKSREQLERKALIYEAMQSGKYQHDEYENEDQGPLIDFDRKYMQEKELNESRENNKKRKRKDKEEAEDPWVEFEDEFGRTRIVRQSELPSHQQHSSDNEEEEEEEEFEMKRPGHDGFGDRSNMNHYEADREIRTKGVGFYSFSKTEHERQEQMAKLNALRAETESARHSVTSASEKRKQMLAKNAEKIRARKAVLQAKKHPLQPQHIPTSAPDVNGDSVSQFLQSIRKEME